MGFKRRVRKGRAVGEERGRPLSQEVFGEGDLAVPRTLKRPSPSSVRPSMHPAHWTPPNSLRSHVAPRWSAGWWRAPPRVPTLRSFHPGEGLFSAENRLSFSGLDPSFVSSDTGGPPPPPPPSPGCSSHGGWCFGSDFNAVFNGRDTLYAPCSRGAISSEKHARVPDACGMQGRNGGLYSKLPNICLGDKLVQ